MKTSALLPLVLLLPLPVFAATVTLPADPSIFRQDPKHFGGFLSDGINLTVADDFRLTQDTLITGLRWWGGNYHTPSAPHRFTVSFYADAQGEPGELLGEYALGSAFQRSTGARMDEIRPEVEYSAGLSAPLLAEAGVRYWMSIITPPEQYWIWEVSGEFNSQRMGVQRLGQVGGWMPYYNETAFELVGIPEPASLTLSTLSCTALLMRRRRAPTCHRKSEASAACSPV